VKIWTLEEVAEILAELILEYGPDFVYEERKSSNTGGGGCRYVWDGKPDCAVGHALHRMGVPLDVLASYDAGGGTIAFPVIDNLADLGYFQMDHEAASFLSRFQNAQDTGTPWGLAFVEAGRTSN